MNPFSHLGLDEQFWLPPIAPPMSLAEAREQRNREDVLREQLVVAADEVIRLRAEVMRLRDAATQATEQLRAALATN